VSYIQITNKVIRLNILVLLLISHCHPFVGKHTVKPSLWRPDSNYHLLKISKINAACLELFRVMKDTRWLQKTQASHEAIFSMIPLCQNR